MTTYILFSGNEKGATGEQHTKMREAISRALELRQDVARVASIMFARAPELRQERFDDPVRTTLQAKWFGEGFLRRLVTPESLASDVDWASIVYLQGGDTPRLAEELDKVPNLAEIFAGKIVVGNSAGSLYLAAAGYDPDYYKVAKHRGLVRAAIIPHYGNEHYAEQFGEVNRMRSVDWVLAEREVREAVPDLPFYRLPEGDFEMFEEAE